jgi:hypothetical protein
MLCEEARARGKNIIRINKIVDIADKAVMEELDNHWHTGTPTETGEYLVCIRYDMGEMGYTTANYVEPFNPHTGWYNLKPPSEVSAEEWCKKNGIEVIAWQKIEPYEASTNQGGEKK